MHSGQWPIGGSAKPRFSVIMVVRNKAEGAFLTLESVAAQKNADFEIVVIDGASTDATVDVLNAFRSKLAYYSSEPDKGIYDAMMKGARAACGEWIIFMNAGDRFYNEYVLSTIGNLGDAAIAYGDARIDIGSWGSPWAKDEISSVWKRMPFAHQAQLIRREKQLAYGFRDQFKIVADFDLICRAAANGEKFAPLGQIICRLEPAGFSGESFRARTMERFRSARENFPTLRVWRHYFSLIAGRALAVLKSFTNSLKPGRA